MFEGVTINNLISKLTEMLNYKFNHVQSSDAISAERGTLKFEIYLVFDVWLLSYQACPG
jgi:hypothetical protein